MARGPRTFTVAEELDDASLASALRALAGPMSWAQAKRLIANRHVLVNGSLSLNEARRVKAGDMIELHDEPRSAVPREDDIRVLYIDPDLIVIDKPAGIVTLRRDEERELSPQRKDLQPTLDELVPQLLPGHTRRTPRRANQKSKVKSQKSFIHAVHRLDRDTSGLMIFALSSRSRDWLIEMFKEHRVRRTYWAVVHGNIAAPLTIETMLVRDRGDGLRGSAWADGKDDTAQRALTRVRPIERIGEGYTIIECELETGRTHQIRIHLAEIGHMLCGEKLYLSPRAGAARQVDTSGAARQALHSKSLEFIHPTSGRPMTFESPAPRDLAQWLERLRNAERR